MKTKKPQPKKPALKYKIHRAKTPAYFGRATLEIDDALDYLQEQDHLMHKAILKQYDNKHKSF